MIVSPLRLCFCKKLSTTFKPYFQFRLFIYTISLSLPRIETPPFRFFLSLFPRSSPSFLSLRVCSLSLSRIFSHFLASSFRSLARSYSFSGAWFFWGEEKEESRCAMEYGGGRKRFRPEAALNGNGGFKKSKPGMPSHCSSTYTRKHIFLLLCYV